MITEIVLLNFIFWEILCHTGYPTESLRFSQRKIDVDSPFCLLRGNVRVKKNPPSYELLSIENITGNAGNTFTFNKSLPPVGLGKRFTFPVTALYSRNCNYFNHDIFRKNKDHFSN